MAIDHRPSGLFAFVTIVALGLSFLVWDRFENRDLPSDGQFGIQSSVQAVSTNPSVADATARSGAAATSGGQMGKKPAPGDKLQTREEFVEAFKSLLMSNITMDDAKRCARVINDRNICGAWDETDNMLQSERALAGQDLVGLVSPHYISCLRAKKQEMIDGFVDGSSTYNIQERNVLVAKAACLSRAVSTVVEEARAAAGAGATTAKTEHDRHAVSN